MLHRNLIYIDSLCSHLNLAVLLTSSVSNAPDGPLAIFV
jgi:hypothetical protein